MPRLGNYDEDETRAMLKQYILPEECASDPFPTDLRPEWVNSFLRDEFKSDLGLLATHRATDLARFYSLPERVEQFLQAIGGNEKTDRDFERSCHLIIAACELGTPDQQSAAVKQFERLLASPNVRPGLELLINTFFSLPPRVPSADLRKRVGELRVEVERKGPEEDVGEFMEFDLRLLPWVIAAKTRKDSILAQPDAAQRLQRWAEAYLGYENTTPFTWDRAAGFALAQEARDQGDAPAVKALTIAMERIDPKKEDREEVKFRKTRGYRARRYYLEPLTEEQQEDMGDAERAQADLIA